MSGIGAFHACDAVVIAQFPIELASADIDSVDVLGAVLQHTVGESASA